MSARTPVVRPAGRRILDMDGCQPRAEHERRARLTLQNASSDDGAFIRRPFLGRRGGSQPVAVAFGTEGQNRSKAGWVVNGKGRSSHRFSGHAKLLRRALHWRSAEGEKGPPAAIRLLPRAAGQGRWRIPWSANWESAGAMRRHGYRARLLFKDVFVARGCCPDAARRLFSGRPMAPGRTCFLTLSPTYVGLAAGRRTIFHRGAICAAEVAGTPPVKRRIVSGPSRSRWRRCRIKLGADQRRSGFQAATESPRPIQPRSRCWRAYCRAIFPRWKVPTKSATLAIRPPAAGQAMLNEIV